MSWTAGKDIAHSKYGTTAVLYQRLTGTLPWGNAVLDKELFELTRMTAAYWLEAQGARGIKVQHHLKITLMPSLERKNSATMAVGA